MTTHNPFRDVEQFRTRLNRFSTTSIYFDQFRLFHRKVDKIDQVFEYELYVDSEVFKGLNHDFSIHFDRFRLFHRNADKMDQIFEFEQYIDSGVFRGVYHDCSIELQAKCK